LIDQARFGNLSLHADWLCLYRILGLVQRGRLRQFQLSSQCLIPPHHARNGLSRHSQICKVDNGIRVQVEWRFDAVDVGQNDVLPYVCLSQMHHFLSGRR
jgi:hypothetical protein